MLSPDDIRDVCQAGKDRDPGWYRIHRKLSIHVTARLLDTRMELNHVSGLMMAMGVAGAALSLSANLAVNALGWVCLYAAFLLDKVDGEMARYRRQESVIGILLDRFHHRLVEPLLFLAVGLRAARATGSVTPVIAALAAMLAANAIEEVQHLPAYIAAKFARETRRWPVAARSVSPRLARVAAVMRSLKTFRTFITVVPLVIAAMLAEAATGRPVTTWLLVASAILLWVYAIFQAWYYASGRLEAGIESLVRELPALPPAPAPAMPAVTNVPTPAADGTVPRPGAAHAGATPLALPALLVAPAGPASAATSVSQETRPRCTGAGSCGAARLCCTRAAALAARRVGGPAPAASPAD